MVRVPLAFVFAFVLKAPVVWIWVLILMDHSLRAVWLLASFQRGRWRRALDHPLGPGETAR